MGARQDGEREAGLRQSTDSSIVTRQEAECNRTETGRWEDVPVFVCSSSLLIVSICSHMNNNHLAETKRVNVS